MKILFVISILLGFCCSCSKSNDNLSKVCYKGKYVGEGCWPVIQIIKPLDDKFKNSTWGTSTVIYNNAVGVGLLPDKYKDGTPFYFTISKIDSNIVHTDNCTVPKYSIAINNYTDSLCNNLNK